MSIGSKDSRLFWLGNEICKIGSLWIFWFARSLRSPHPSLVCAIEHISRPRNTFSQYSHQTPCDIFICLRRAYPAVELMAPPSNARKRASGTKSSSTKWGRKKAGEVIDLINDSSDESIGAPPAKRRTTNNTDGSGGRRSSTASATSAPDLQAAPITVAVVIATSSASPNELKLRGRWWRLELRGGQPSRPNGSERPSCTGMR